MIDVTKCLGCRKGIYIWDKQEGKIKHVDLFASTEAGAIYECTTPGIEEYLFVNENGMLRPKKEYESFFANQSFWWEDILNLAYGVMGDSEKVRSFFNSGPEDNRMHNQSNETIEWTLLNMAEEVGIVVDYPDYPDLLKFKK